jgi:hypothetical protein
VSLESCDSGKESVAVPCEHDPELSVSIKGDELVEYLSDPKGGLCSMELVMVYKW